jgi:hypothetical protein
VEDFILSIVLIPYLYVLLFLTSIRNLFRSKKRARKRRKTMKYVNEDGETFYYNKKGNIHRTSGPAIISLIYKAWLIDGKLHREDGPAKVWVDGTREYYLNNELLPEKEYLTRVSKLGKVLYG